MYFYDKILDAGICVYLTSSLPNFNTLFFLNKAEAV